VVSPPEPKPAPAAPETKPPAASPPAPEEADLTWEDKEDKEGKLAAEKKYQYKEGVSLDLGPSRPPLLSR